MPGERVIVILGSRKDLRFSIPIGETLNEFGVAYEYRVASAHKTPKKLLQILEEYEGSDDNIVYITVAGRSNALSGFVDANTRRPVIACPPYSEEFGGADVLSSLRMPSGVAPLVVLEPEAAALAAVKILGLGSQELCEKVHERLEEARSAVDEDDSTTRGKKIFGLEKELMEGGS